VKHMLHASELEGPVVIGPELFDGFGMVLEHHVLEPGERLRWDAPADASERSVYVARGSGYAEVAGEQLALGHESALWLEPGEQCSFAAGDDGLELLAAVAPVPERA